MSQNFNSPLHMMEGLGGSFVRSLVACYQAADPTNKAKLRAAFADYFTLYERRFEACQQGHATEALQDINRDAA